MSTPLASSMDSTADALLDDLAGLLKALADPLRLEVLRLLGQSSFGVLELADMLDVSQPGMSHHLKVLAQAHWVETRREGNSIFYRRRLPVTGEIGWQLRTRLFDELDESAITGELAARLEQVQEQRALQSREFFARHATLFAERQDLIAEHELYDDAAFAMLQRARPQCGGKALEIGPGKGHFLARLADRFDSVVGLDSVPELLAQVRARLAGFNRARVQLMEANWPKAEVSNDFDLIAFNMVLHHLPTPKVAVREAAARLAQNGILLITELCRHEQDWVRESCGDLWQGFDESELAAWAERAGLEHDESQFIALKNGFQIQILSFRKNSSETALRA